MAKQKVKGLMKKSDKDKKKPTGYVRKKAPVPKKGNIFTRINRYLRESRLELKKVTWPSRQEVIASAVIVLTVTMILAAIIGSFDFVFAKLLKAVSF